MNLDREEFKAWLESKSPVTRVGERGSGCNCPVARYIKATSPVKIKNLIVGGLWIEINGKKSDPPEWVVSFVAFVDEGPAQNITASRALEILNEHA